MPTILDESTLNEIRKRKNPYSHEIISMVDEILEHRRRVNENVQQVQGAQAANSIRSHYERTLLRMQPQRGMLTGIKSTKPL